MRHVSSRRIRTLFHLLLASVCMMLVSHFHHPHAHVSGAEGEAELDDEIENVRGSRKCIPAPSSCERVVDLTCGTRMNPEAFYHRLVDCFLPEYALVKNATSDAPGARCLFGYGTRYKFYEALNLTPKPSREKQNALFPRDFPCASANHGTERLYGALPYHVKDLIRNHTILPALRNNAIALSGDVQRIYGNSLRKEAFVLLVVMRTGTRSFQVESLRRLVNVLEAIPSAQVSTYTGNEDVKTTIELFSRADAIVMYHGGAAANLLFCNKSAIVIEITTYTDYGSINKWRRNTDQIAIIRPDMQINVYSIPLIQVLTDASWTGKASSAKDVDLLVKGARHIRLQNSDCENIKHIILSLRPKVMI